MRVRGLIRALGCPDRYWGDLTGVSIRSHEFCVNYEPIKVIFFVYKPTPKAGV